MRDVISKKDQYLNDLYYFEDKHLQAISNRLKNDNKWGINIGYHEISLLQFFIQQFKVKNILEVGTLYGFSTYAMAQALPEGGVVTSLEKNKENHQAATELLSATPVETKIQLIHQDAKDYLANCQKTFDLIFIDANKSGYAGYLTKSLELLTKEGLIVGDNTFLFGHVYGEGINRTSDAAINSMQSFNKSLLANKDYQVITIPTTEGMTIIKKR